MVGNAEITVRFLNECEIANAIIEDVVSTDKSACRWQLPGNGISVSTLS